MSTMQTLLEKDKERFLHNAAAVRSSAETVRLVEDELGRLLTLYNEEEENEKIKQTAMILIQALSAAAGLLDCDGDSVIYTRSQYRPGVSKPKKSAWFFLFFIFGIILLIGGCGAAIYLTDTLPPSEELLISLGILAASALFLFLAGLFSARKKSENQQELYAETIPDPEKTYRILLNEVLTMDKILEQLRKEELLAERQALLSEKDGMKKEDIQLLTNLLEATYTDDSDQAKETVSELKFYLHRKNINVIDYNGDNAELFEKLPGSENKTIRPALTIGDQVIRKGLATGE